MPLEYSKAKNESLTCRYNNIFLHSSYNPQNESFRFAESINPDFIPQNIIIIEPALSYCKIDLEKKFPSSKIFAIRFIPEIKSDISFDKEFEFKNSNQIKNELFNYFGETGLLNSFFITWPPSAKCFTDKDRELWLLIKALLKECQNILATRQFFAKRWIKNEIKFLSNIFRCSKLNKIDVPIFITASGPSLKNCLSFLRENQNNFFIIACSSSIRTLLKNTIVPDLCISTDGGFWAKKHLYELSKYHEIKLAISIEANLNSKLFKTNTIIPLAYCDNYDNSIFENFNIPYNKAVRNGTISGTALELALSLTDKDIYFAGLDLESGKGFSHTAPNELEIENSLKDNKLKPADTRLFNNQLDSPQLELYRNWFISNSEKFTKREKNQNVYRVYSNHTFRHTLGNISDLDISKIKLEKINKKNYFEKEKEISISKTEIQQLFEKLFKDEYYINNYFPADSISINRTNDKAKKTELQKALEKKIESLIKFAAPKDTK